MTTGHQRSGWAISSSPKRCPTSPALALRCARSPAKAGGCACGAARWTGHGQNWRPSAHPARFTIPHPERMIKIIRNRPMPAGFIDECKRSAPPIRRGNQTLRGRRTCSLKRWNRKWRAAPKAAGIGDFRCHDLRHRSRTRIARACGHLTVTHKLPGHASFSTKARDADVCDDDIHLAMKAAQPRNSPRPRRITNGETSGKTKRKRVEDNRLPSQMRCPTAALPDAFLPWVKPLKSARPAAGIR